MPKIKTKRNDIIRRPEATELMSKSPLWLGCMIAFLILFGKRINEVLKLRKEDVWIEGKYLYVRFFVSKKKTRQSEPIPKAYIKRILLEHYATPFIWDHLKTVNEGLLFPKMTRQLALYYLKKENPKVWFHLFRHSLATQMAEKGFDVLQLVDWFDWDRVDTALDYVKRGTKLTEELSERTW